MIDHSTIKFLLEASSDHNAEWLTDNKAQMACARRNLMELTSQLIASAGSIDPRIAEANPDPRKCLAKVPISKGVGSISVRVSKSKNAAATYFMQISPSRSYGGGGALLPPPRLARILRQTIASHTGKWRGIVEGPLFQKYFPNRLTGGHEAGGKGYKKNHDALHFFNLILQPQKFWRMLHYLRPDVDVSRSGSGDSKIFCSRPCLDRLYQSGNDAPSGGWLTNDFYTHAHRSKALIIGYLFDTSTISSSACKRLFGKYLVARSGRQTSMRELLRRVPAIYLPLHGLLA